MSAEKRPPRLRVGTAWTRVRVLSEPYVVLTVRGYVPALRVEEIGTGLDHELFISAKSLAEGLEELRRYNGGRFEGLQFRLRKESTEKMAPYEVEGDNEES